MSSCSDRAILSGIWDGGKAGGTSNRQTLLHAF